MTRTDGPRAAAPLPAAPAACRPGPDASELVGAGPPGRVSRGAAAGRRGRPSGTHQGPARGPPLAPDDLRPDRDPDPEVRAWVLALWAERLVGGEPVRGDEPPAIVAIAGPTPIARFRLFQLAGLAKVVLADPDSTGTEGPLDGERLAWLSERLGPRRPTRPGLGQARPPGDRPGRQPERAQPRRCLGLATVARLLADCDPFRVRWALQHLPYPIAKRIRSLMPAPGSGPPPSRDWKPCS